MDKHTDRPVDEGRAPSSRPQDDEHNSTKGSDSTAKSYLRFAAMILTSMVFMYGVTYLNTFQLDHVRWSEMRGFMTLLMGSTMAVVMLLSCWACTRTG
jgi:cytochrome c oxidase subunit IV